MADTGPNEPAPSNQGTTSSGDGAVTFNLTYLKSPKGILKIVEIFLLMIAFSCAADGCSRWCTSTVGEHSFFLFATIMPWILCIIIFVLFLLCLAEKVRINWKITVLINSAIWAIVLLIAASLWAHQIDNKRKIPYLEFKDGRLYASVVFAFFAIIAFIVDIVVHIKY